MYYTDIQIKTVSKINTRLKDDYYLKHTNNDL